MSDGPFKNTELSADWKRYGQELVSDAASTGERAIQACRSMMGDINMKELTPLFSKLKAHSERLQMELDPAVEVEAIFECHSPSPFTDVFQRHLASKLREQISPSKAFGDALSNTVKELIGVTQNRLDEECIRARDRGDMSIKDYRKGIERNHETFAAIEPSDICNALVTGNTRAFALRAQEKDSVDEGPEE